MTARVAFLGDTLLGSKAQETLDREGYAHALAGIRPLLADADLVIANHEGPVTAAAPPATKEYGAKRPAWRRADPASLDALREAGIGLVGLGNNHMLDHGRDGLADTVTAFEKAGIRHCGAGRDAAAAGRAAEVVVAGERLVVVSGMAARRRYVDAGFYAGPERCGPALLQPSLVEPADGALPVVLAHWGPGYGPVDPEQRALAAGLRGAGAGLVVGTHPHSPQGVDLEAAPVLFSLGNGAYGSMGRFARHGAEPYGLVATVEVSGARVVALELRAILTDNKVVRFQPRPAADSRALAFLHSLLGGDADWYPVKGGVRRDLT